MTKMDIPEAALTPGDLEVGNNDGGGGEATYLKFNRLVRKVEVKEHNAGLMRSSIAAPTPQTREMVQRSGPVTKTILNQVSGYAAPGQVLALMGPSGSGKTSLLDTLSGRSKFNSGTLMINGQKATTQSMKRLMSKVAYVKQADVFFGHLTLQDQLSYTALLRLPSRWESSRKHAEVARIIKMLRLTKVAQSSINMLSGGEKKRVNIGTELLTDPSVILLDEPTSGLDSTSAVALLAMLQRLARQHGKTIVTSIHQPSSAVFRSFDRLMMLADGNVVYFGTPVGSLEYLKDLGYSCPSGYNAADHWMDLLVVDTAIDEDDNHLLLDAKSASDENDENDDDNDETESVMEKEQDEVLTATQQRRRSSVLDIRSTLSSSCSTRQVLIRAWDNEQEAATGDGTDELDASVHDEIFQSELSTSFKKYNTSWWTQYGVLTHRSMKNSRSAIFTPLNVIKSACIGLIAGLLWFQLENTEKTIQDRSSYYFFTMTYWVFDSMFNALMAFPDERAIIFKERASASYHLSAYFMAKTTSEAPTRMILPAVYMSISFWMAGVHPSLFVFLGSTICTLLSVMAGESIGLFIGASVMDFQRAITLMTVFSLALMLVGGYFVENIPSFMRWLSFLSPFKYAFDASQQMVFDRNVPCDGSGFLESICGDNVEYATAQQVKDLLNIQGSVAFNVGMLFVMFLLPRYGAYLALRMKKQRGRA